MLLYKNTEIKRLGSTLNNLLSEEITILLKSLQIIALRRF